MSYTNNQCLNHIRPSRLKKPFKQHAALVELLQVVHAHRDVLLRLHLHLEVEEFPRLILIVVLVIDLDDIRDLVLNAPPGSLLHLVHDHDLDRRCILEVGQEMPPVRMHHLVEIVDPHCLRKQGGCGTVRFCTSTNFIHTAVYQDPTFMLTALQH